jgi:hypothetical protein
MVGHCLQTLRTGLEAIADNSKGGIEPMSFAMNAICARCGEEWGDHGALQLACPDKQGFFTAVSEKPKQPPFPFKVRCIDACGVTAVVVGQIYTVIRDSSDGAYFYLEEIELGSWSKKRFEILSDECPTIPPPANKTGGQADANEWRKWRDVNRDVASECPCGMLRAQCSYHS